MNKLFAVFKREYLQAVRKKMFIIMTFLLPLLMAGLFFLPSLLMMKGLGEKKVVVLDGSGALRSAFEHQNQTPKPEEKSPLKRARRDEVPTSIKIQYIARPGDPSLDATAKPYLGRLSDEDKQRQLDGVFVIPSDALTNAETRMKFYSRSATDFITQERLSGIANRGIQRFRLTQRGLDPEQIEQVLTETPVDAVQLSKSGEQKKGGAATFLVGFMLTALILFPSFLYGLEIMRGIIQEKNDRVVEILISSMSTSQLLIGKILGVAAVGLTQIGVWLLMAAGAGAFFATTAKFAGVEVMQFLNISFFVYFVVFFLLMYLTYVCIYAIGGAVCNSDKEAQQLIAPITMTMMIPWFMMAAIITNPDSPLAVGFSLAPVFGPLTMFVRTLVAEPPMWHVLLSIAVSLATISVFFWITAKVFRVGILSYGKRPTIPELWRWLKVA
ncbi:MAG: ABC transporter permease [Thermoanaerobaculia bacterium]